MLARTRGRGCSDMSRSRQIVNMSRIFVHMERRAGAHTIKSLKSGPCTRPHHHHSRRVICPMLIREKRWFVLKIPRGDTNGMGEDKGDSA